MSKHALLLSIRPRFAKMIFDGTKTVELRRVKPKVKAGDSILLYVSSPTKELQGSFRVAKSISGSPLILWRKVGKGSGITRKEFLAYFRGKKQAHALVIGETWVLSKPVRLARLRKKRGGFRPPQSFHYVRDRRPPSLFGMTLRFRRNGHKTRNPL